MVAGCPATGAADCEALIPRLWQQLLVKRGIKVPTLLDPPWASAHLAQLAVGLIPSSIQAYLPGSDWMLPTILNDFAMGLAARLAEVLRRRESLLADRLRILQLLPVRAPLPLVPHRWLLPAKYP